MKRIVVLVIIGLVTIGIGRVVLTKNTNEEAFAQGIEQCNIAAIELRYSCYRSIIQKHFSGSLSGYVHRVEDSKKIAFATGDNSYAIFGTNCHTFYHALGDFIASNVQKNDVKKAIGLCPLGCTEGCVMGVSKRMSLRNGYDTDFFKSFYESCRKEEKHHCAHEIGHNLTDKYTTSVLQTIDDLTQKNYGFTTGQSYQYRTKNEPDLNGAFTECREILPEKEWPYCYTGVGHNLYLFSELSAGGYAPQIEACNGTDAKNKEDCLSFFMLRIGINDAAPKFLNNRFDEGIAVCDTVSSLMKRPDLEARCYTGLGGGIGFFVEGTYKKNEAYQQKSIPTLQKEFLKLGSLCNHAPAQFRNKCYLGLLNTVFRPWYEDLYLRDETIDRIFAKKEGLVEFSDDGTIPFPQ